MLGVVSSYLLGSAQCKHFSGPVSAINACSCIYYKDSEDLVLVLLASHIQKPKERQKRWETTLSLHTFTEKDILQFNAICR